MAKKTIILNGENLTLEEFNSIIKSEADVVISKDSLKLLHSTRELIYELSNSDREIYGLTTGVGANKDNRIAPEYFATFNRNLILAHCVGVKPYGDTEVVRGSMLIRLNTLLLGATGINPDIALMYMEFLNRGIHPLIPMRGSVGAADVTCLSHIGLGMMGEGRVEYRGEVIPAGDAILREGLKAITLGPKDGLAIVSSNALSAAIAGIAYKEVMDLIDMAEVIYALTLEGIGINRMFINPKSNELRRLDGQRLSNDRVVRYLEGSSIWDNDNNTLHGSMVFKAGWAVYGSVRDAMEYVYRYLDIQMNSSDDCPRVLVDEKDIISTANFMVTSLALGFEMLAIALGHMSKSMCYRILKMSQTNFTKLPRFLRPQTDVIAFSTMQKTFTSLDTEIRHLVNPSSLDYIATSNETEDHSCNAPFVMSKVRKIVDNLRYILGIELMHACQAIDLKEIENLGRGSGIAYRLFREKVPFLDRDRDLSIDIESAYELIKSGKIIDEIICEYNE